jgi:hypothetical protein
MVSASSRPSHTTVPSPFVAPSTLSIRFKEAVRIANADLDRGGSR